MLTIQRHTHQLQHPNGSTRPPRTFSLLAGFIADKVWQNPSSNGEVRIVVDHDSFKLCLESGRVVSKAKHSSKHKGIRMILPSPLRLGLWPLPNLPQKFRKRKR